MVSMLAYPVQAQQPVIAVPGIRPVTSPLAAAPTSVHTTMNAPRVVHAASIASLSA